MKIDLSKQKYRSQYKDKKFKTERGFLKWLNGLSAAIIEFKQNGQDCTMWQIDEGGEVLHSDMQGSVWIGMIVDLSHLKVGKEIGVMDVPNQQTKFYDFVVTRIIPTVKKK